MCDTGEYKVKEGSAITFKVYQGKMFPPFFIGNVRDHLQEIKDMEVRDDDTFILSYPKSGTHWISSITKMLRTKNTSYTGSPNFVDFNSVESLDDLRSPRVLASHMTYDCLPRQAQEGKGKVIAIFRNPKDAAVSLYQFVITMHSNVFHLPFWNGFLKDYLDGKMLYGSWFDSLFEWEKTKKTYKGKDVLYLHYEDLKEDLMANVVKVASFLGENHDTRFLEDVTNRCTFESMQQAAIDESNPKDQWKEVSETRTLPIYRKGEVGDWKNYFTVAQNENFDKIYSDKMADSSFTFRFT